MDILILNTLHVGNDAVGAQETPLGGWSVTRLRTAAHGMLHSSGLSLAIGPKGGLGDLGDAVFRQLILTKASLVERRPENYEVSPSLVMHLLRIKCSELSDVLFKKTFLSP